MPGLSMTKVKNQLKKNYPHITPHLTNIRINGDLRGCSGFLVDNNTNNIVYINTEISDYDHRVYYRTAAHLKDFSGGRNHFCDNAEIVDKAIELLLENN